MSRMIIILKVHLNSKHVYTFKQIYIIINHFTDKTLRYFGRHCEMDTLD